MKISVGAGKILRFALSALDKIFFFKQLTYAGKRYAFMRRSVLENLFALFLRQAVILKAKIVKLVAESKFAVQ